jgi:zinc protease
MKPNIASPTKTVTADAHSAIQVPQATARVWTLANGLTIIVQEDHSAPVASLQAWCKTGSIHEDQWLGGGLSHLLEHLLFKGTPSRSGSEIAQQVQNAGGYINAYTSFDRTVYWIDIPSKGATTALDILADAVMNSTLPAEEFEKEREVIRREFAMTYDDPDRISSHDLFEAAYSTHPYRMPVIGYMDVFNALTREDVLAYYRSRYVPNNLFFVIVGDVNPEEIHAQLTAFFSEHPRRPLPPLYLPAEPAQLGKRELHKEFATELTRLHLAWHIPGITHPDVPALDILAAVIGDGRSSHLYRELREQTALVHSVSAYSYTPQHPGIFGVEAVLDPEKQEEATRAILEIIERAKEQGVTPTELAKAKKQYLASHVNHLATMRGKASDLGSNWLITRNLDFSNLHLKSLQRVTSEDIRRVANLYLHEENLTVTSLNPPGALAAEIAAHPPLQAGPIQKFTLPNGLTLLVREDPRLPLVSMVTVFKAGLLAETAANNGLTALCARVMLKGTTTRSAGQIADEIESSGGHIGCDAGNNSLSFSVKVMQPDLRLGLNILADVIQNPAFAEANLAREKDALLAAIKSEEEEMTVVARHLLRENLFANHPYGLRGHGTVESVANLTAADLRAFHTQFLCAKNGVLAIYGNVKATEVLLLVEAEFARLNPGQPELLAPPSPTPITAARTVELRKDKTQAILMVGYHGVNLYHPDRAVLELIDEACSDLASRFFIRIREEMGLAYFVGTSQMTGLAPGPFVFYLGTDPARVDEVRAALLDEIAHLAEHGLTAAELSRAKEKYLGQEEIRNQSEDAFAFVTALDELYSLGFAHHETMKAEISAITIEDTRRVAQKYFRDQPGILAIVKP